ncbi:MAG: hypothetical protein N2517_07175 [Ignavibacteria bacterium]|nr:hypothetical protein [Ignavibacteria bacterium]
MIKIVFLVLSVLYVLPGCSEEKFTAEEKKFIATYKEILLARYTIADSTEADKEVKKILKKNGYTFREFLNKSIEIRSRDPKKFNEIIDSIRTTAINEIIEAKKKEFGQPSQR